MRKRRIEIAKDGKKWSRIKIGIDTSRLIPKFAKAGEDEEDGSDKRENRGASVRA